MARLSVFNLFDCCGRLLTAAFKAINSSHKRTSSFFFILFKFRFKKNKP